jgi:hypothetical protein
MSAKALNVPGELTEAGEPAQAAETLVDGALTT